MPKREQLYHEPANLKFCMKFQNFNQSRYQNMLLVKANLNIVENKYFINSTIDAIVQDKNNKKIRMKMP